MSLVYRTKLMRQIDMTANPTFLEYILEAGLAMELVLRDTKLEDMTDAVIALVLVLCPWLLIVPEELSMTFVTTIAIVRGCGSGVNVQRGGVGGRGAALAALQPESSAPKVEANDGLSVA
jgi:hypothetical protein